MNWQEHKLEWSVALGLGLVLASLFFGFRSLQQRNFETADVSYEMVRPDNFVPSEYDLSGRQIERKVLNPFEKIIAAIKSIIKKDDKKAATVQAQATAQKAAEKAKKNEAKKAAAKPKFQLQVVERPEQTKRAQALASNPFRKVQNLNAPVAAALPAIPAEQDQVKESTAEAQEIKEALLKEPSIENMQKLLSAVAGQKVTASEFFSLSKTLLNDSNPATQYVGLYGLQSFPQAQSFILTAQSYDRLNDQNKVYADQIMMSYSQPQRVSMLGEVLRSEDEEVVIKAGAVITVALDRIDQKENNIQSSVRGGLRGQSLPTTVSPYLGLVPVLEEVTSKSNSNLKEILSNILEHISTLNQNS